MIPYEGQTDTNSSNRNDNNQDSLTTDLKARRHLLKGLGHVEADVGHGVRGHSQHQRKHLLLIAEQSTASSCRGTSAKHRFPSQPVFTK